MCLALVLSQGGHQALHLDLKAVYLRGVGSIVRIPQVLFELMILKVVGSLLQLLNCSKLRVSAVMNATPPPLSASK